MTHAVPQIGDLLGRRDLLVVGAGPVGLAALWFARTRGIDAIAVDAARGPLATIRAYPPSLVTLSTAGEWEIDGLPLDCRDAFEVTREDLVSYYARVAAYGDLRFACGQRVVAIEPHGDEVRVVVETSDGPAHWIAARVLVTPWYRARTLSVAGADAHGVTVHDGAAGVEPIGRANVVVVGAGLSGLEACDLLIRNGARVALVARGEPRLTPEIATLFERSGSQVVARATRVAVMERGTVTIEHDGGATEVAARDVVNCTGQEPNRALLDALHRVSLLDDAERAALLALRPRALETPDVSAIASSYPRLEDALWRGRRGVHFAGTVFHVGGVFGGGIVYSIETAAWAIDAIVGRRDDAHPDASVHLPSFFHDAITRGPRPRTARWSAHLAGIVPVPIAAWSRGIKLFEGESATGGRGGAASRESRALGEAREELLTELRAACYEGASVGQLAALLELEPEVLVSNLRALWYGNGLTWVPPGDE